MAKLTTYQVTEIAKDTWVINEAGMTAMFLLKGTERALLIDTGVGMTDLKKLISWLTPLPYDVVLTHGHPDHIGGAAQFEEVYIHEKDEDSLKPINYDSIADYVELLGNMGAYDVYDCSPADIRRIQKMPKCLPLKEGMVFELGGRSIEVKIGAGTHKRLANVPFKITSKTTGESHSIVTDKNGQFSTASDWASHKKNTNAGKSSEDGIWFGTSEPDDSKGALLYDTYEIEELACESNKGMKLIPAFEVVVSRNKVTIDLGTLTDEYEKEITIHTTATDKETGEKIIVAGKKVTIVDTVTLDGLEEGRKYQLKGWQMLKEENAELLIDGKRVESDYTFVADNEKMKVGISYMFDASELGGQNLVTFEELYDLKSPEEPVKVAEHKDIDDEGQTVLITERKISIHTTATDKNGKKEMEAGKDLTIVDTVTLEGLEIGTKYKLSGWQMIKKENAKLLIDGKEVTNDYEFTADKENMEVQIEFTFDGSTLGGKQFVTFEELYDMTNPEEPKKVTEHKDINEEGQTVTIKEVPETPTPETPGTTTKTSNPPKTGDTENAALWIAILVLSAAGITGVRIWNKKKQVKRLGIEEKKEEEE